MQRCTRAPEPIALALPRARSWGERFSFSSALPALRHTSHRSRRVSVGRRAPAAPAAGRPERKMLSSGRAGLIESSHERVQHDPHDAEAVGSSVALTPGRLGSAVAPTAPARSALDSTYQLIRCWARQKAAPAAVVWLGCPVIIPPPRGGRSRWLRPCDRPDPASPATRSVLRLDCPVGRSCGAVEKTRRGDS